MIKSGRFCIEGGEGGGGKEWKSEGGGVGYAFGGGGEEGKGVNCKPRRWINRVGRGGGGGTKELHAL